MDNKIIVVAGPTASGKTSLGIEIARAVNGEIICADSMQVYKNMPVATAAPTKEEQSRVRHYLNEFLEPDREFSVALWCDLAKKTADDILKRGKTPVIVGGTGLFIDSFVDNISFEDVRINEELRAKLMSKDVDELYNELKRVDSESAENIHKNNKKRVARALELYYSGVTKTQQNKNSKKEKSPYEFLYFVLDYKDRQNLYDRINKRVDLMVEQGIVDEARECLSKAVKTSAQAIGHKELKPYLDGEITLDEALDNLKKETRHYAKRQITWFKRRENAVHLVLDEDREDAVKEAVKQCEDFLNGTVTREKSE